MAGVQSPSASVWLTTIPCAVNVVGMTFSLFLVDRVGRRPLVLTSMFGKLVMATEEVQVSYMHASKTVILYTL